MIVINEEIIITEKEYKQAEIEARHAINTALGSIENMIEDLEENAGRDVIYNTKDRVKTKKSCEGKCKRKNC